MHNMSLKIREKVWKKPLKKKNVEPFLLQAFPAPGAPGA